MIDLSVPSDTLGLFNFKQFVKKDGKNTFKYIFFDNYDYIINLHDKGKLRDVSFDNVQKTILVMISLSVLTAAMKLLLLIPAVPDTVPNVVLNPVKDALLMSALWLLNPNIVISSLPSLLSFASTLSKTDHCLMVFLSLPEILWLPFSTTENIADKSVLKKRKVSSIIKKAINLNIFTKIQLIM